MGPCALPVVATRVGGTPALVKDGATGLLVVGVLADRFGSYGPAFLVVAAGPVLAAVLVLRWFPETARVELEDLNPGDVPV